jgi:hypothetical protein
MRSASLLAALAVLAAAAPPAFAKAPAAKDMPSVEEIFQQATAAIEEAKRIAAERARDPLKEAIDAYRERGKVAIGEYQKLVDIINNARDEAVQPYRAPAAQAIITRFSQEGDTDPQVRTVRRQIALSLLDLMKAQKDETGLQAIEQILYAWWRSQMTMGTIKFTAKDRLDDRKKAHAKMKRFLSAGEN